MFRNSPKDRLVSDIKQVISDLDSLLRETASDASDQASSAGSRLRQSLRSARNSMGDFESHVSDGARVAREQARAAYRYTDDYVHDHPWQVVGAAAGVGALIALLLYASRR